MMIITQILKQLRLNHETIKKLKKENKDQRKLLGKLSDNLVHKEELLRVFQEYTKKVAKKYKISQKEVEASLEKICFPCPCLLRSIKNFVKNNLEELLAKENSSKQTKPKNK